MLYEIIGGRELQAKFGDLGPAVGKQTLRVIEKAMRPLLRRAIEEAPKDTGNLAHHIALEVRESNGRVEADLVVNEVRYAAPVHLGVPAIHRSPDPFLTRAVDAGGNAAINRARGEIADAIDREAQA